MTWLLTCEGRPHYIAGPYVGTADNVPTLSEIAHSLAQINRFTGHARRPYSVAEHSLLVLGIASHLGASQEVQFAALMHDAHECIVGDVATPIKHVLGAVWSRFEEQQQNLLLHHYGLHEVHQAHRSFLRHCDLVALATERRDLMPFDPEMHAPWPVLDTPGAEVAPSNSPAHHLMHPDAAGSTWYNWAHLFETQAQMLWDGCAGERRAA